MSELADELAKQLKSMVPELDKRCKAYLRQESYYTGACQVPAAIKQLRVTEAYRSLMPMAEAPWGARVVDSVQDRLEVSGIRSPADEDPASAGNRADRTRLASQPTPIDDELWGVWQDNAMDALSKQAHNAALISGRAFALITPMGDKSPEITFDTSEQMIVKYKEGSTRHRVAALRRWAAEDGTVEATLYRPEAAYKFRKSIAANQKEGGARFKLDSDWWEPRPDMNGEWIEPHNLKVVPVVELAVNRRLKPGAFGYARGEYEHCTGLIDRINMLTFLGLVVGFALGFPLRGIIGQQIAWEHLVDDDGEPLIDPATNEQRKRAKPPFRSMADEVFMLEDEDAKLAEYKAADRKLLSPMEELDQLATITGTPRHHFPMSSGMSNLAADAIRASEGIQAAKVVGHKGTLGEGYEEMLRVCGLALPDPIYLSPRAALLWQDHEARSMAERADAAVKLATIVPREVLWERYLNATQEDVARWKSMQMGDVIEGLVQELSKPTPMAEIPATVPA